MEIHRGQNINVLPLHVDTKTTEKGVNKAKRITGKRQRTVTPREINSSWPEQAGSMEVDGDVSRSRPPRVEVEGDDVDMRGPKAAVMKMLRDTKDQQEKNKLQGELSLIEKKKNKESWRRGILERVKKDNVSVEPWGDVNSEVDNEPTVQNQMLNMRPMSQLTAPKKGD